MPQILTYPLLIEAAQAILNTVDSYTSHGAPRSERTLDPVLYGFLLGARTRVDRQVSVSVAGKKCRIDFRCRGNNPANLEWALRPGNGGGQLRAKSNASEIKKLSRTSNARRYLLLVDVTSRDPWTKSELKADYDSVTLGPGKYTRHSVTVVYVHRRLHFRYVWHP